MGKSQKHARIRKVVVIGAGTVGRHIADVLQREQFDLGLIDHNRSALDEVGELLDIQTLHGNGANPDVLQRAQIDQAHLLLALTDSDEVNMIAAFNAKRMGADQTVIRARNAWCQDTTPVDIARLFNIDLILNPEILTAGEIIKFLDNPDALAMLHFAGGKVQLRQFVLDESSRSVFAGRSLRESGDRLPPDVLVVMRSRDGQVEVPKGDHVLQPGDKVTLMGLPERLAEAQELFRVPSEPLRHVAIAGGGNSGLFLARTLEHRNFDVKLIEADADRCQYLSERLRHTTILQGDVTRLGFMKEERIASSDVFVSVMRDDEDNLMACLLAKDLGIKQTVARIQRPDYASLIQRMGVDLALSPRHVMADRILSMIMVGRIKAVSLMEEGQVEVVEFLAQQNMKIVGRPLIEIGNLIPAGALVAAIVHRGQVIVPCGDSQIHPGDTVIVVGLNETLEAVEALFEAG